MHHLLSQLRRRCERATSTYGSCKICIQMKRPYALAFYVSGSLHSIKPCNDNFTDVCQILRPNWAFDFVSRFCNFDVSRNAVLPDLEDRVVMAVMLLLVLRALWHEWVELFRKRSLEVDMRLLELVRLATPLWCISNALLALSLKERVHFNLKFIHEIQQFKNLVHKQLNPTLNYRTKSW